MTAGSSSSSAYTAASSVGVGQQRVQPVAHHAERRLAARGQQQSQEPVDLAVRELLAVDLRVHEVREEVAGRFGASGFDERPQVLDHRFARTMPACRRHRTGVDLLGPLRELAGVLERHADDPADHLDGISGGDGLDEIGLAQRRDRVDESVDRGTHERVVPLFEL